MSKFALVHKLAAEKRAQQYHAFRYSKQLLERDDDVPYLDEDSEESE